MNSPCSIEPDSKGHVTIPYDWDELVNGAIPVNAFQFCSALQSVTIPDSDTIFRINTFSYCEKLQSLTIPVPTSR